MVELWPLQRLLSAMLRPPTWSGWRPHSAVTLGSSRTPAAAVLLGFNRSQSLSHSALHSPRVLRPCSCSRQTCSELPCLLLGAAPIVVWAFSLRIAGRWLLSADHHVFGAVEAPT